MDLPRSILDADRRSGGWSMIDLVLVIAAVLILIALVLPQFARCSCKAVRISCVNNQKQVGTAYRVWAGDNGDQLPFAASDTNGGWRERLSSSSAGIWCWTNYAIMGNELGQSPRVVLCPGDDREAGTNFNNYGVGKPGFDNKNISYFVGVSANVNAPQSILGGDRNLAPGLSSKNDYGYSPANNNGNDVIIQTNSSQNPIVWSLKMHSEGNRQGAGNVLMADGSVRQVTSKGFRVDCQRFAGTPLVVNTPTNALGKAWPSFRLIFP